MARLIDTQYQSSQPDARSALDAMRGWLVARESLAGKPTIPSANLTRAGPLLTSRPPCHPFRAEPAGRACKWGFLPRPPGISSSVPVWNGHWTWSRSEVRAVQFIFHRERRHRPLPPLPFPWDWLHYHAGAEAAGCGRQAARPRRFRHCRRSARAAFAMSAGSRAAREWRA